MALASAMMQPMPSQQHQTPQIEPSSGAGDTLNQIAQLWMMSRMIPKTPIPGSGSAVGAGAGLFGLF